MSGQQALTDFLKKAAGQECVVELSTGSELHGVLCTIDGLFNLVLKDVREIVKGKERNRFPSVFVRGNKVIHVSPACA